MPPFHRPVMAALRLAGFLSWTLSFMPFYALVLGLGRVTLCRRLAVFYWRVTAWLIGIRVVVHGRQTERRPALFVSNHASYLDIVVLGGLIDAVFIAKKEVSQWPGFGTIAKLGRTVFVDRRPRHSLTQRDEMLSRLGRESLILFPEGTSNDGNKVLPFKSALLSVAERLGEGGALPVQPVSLAYTRLDGLPICHDWRAFFAWYGGMDLAPHLWAVLGLGVVTVEVEFHEPCLLSDFPSRKALADHCHKVVAHGVALANSGRRAERPA